MKRYGFAEAANYSDVALAKDLDMMHCLLLKPAIRTARLCFEVHSKFHSPGHSSEQLLPSDLKTVSSSSANTRPLQLNLDNSSQTSHHFRSNHHLCFGFAPRLSTIPS